MRLELPCLVYHPDLTPNLHDVFCFSARGVSPSELVNALLDAAQPGYEVGLPHPQFDCSHLMRRTTTGYQTRQICHGRFTDPWHDATRAEATAWLEPCAKSMIDHNTAEGYLYWVPGDAVA
jgi:hypothetical protein